MPSKRKITTIVGAAVLAGAMSVGAAVAAGPTVLAPRGLTAGPGQDVTPMPEPSYATNEHGLTYGSAADATSPGGEPDLIAAMTTDGRDGYVRKTDLDDADGTTAAASFTSPEDALAWQAERQAMGDIAIPVYERDGTTVIGEFVVGNGHRP